MNSWNKFIKFMLCLQIHVVGVSSCDIPIKVLQSVDHGEYRVFLSKF